MHYSFADVKSVIFDFNLNKYPNLRSFRKNPYTFLKAHYYMHCSCCLVFLLSRTPIRPNLITYLYILSGILGGLFLSLPFSFTNLLAIFVFFNKGILDWSDGSLARLKYSPSIKGHILDEYGARINSVCFSIAIGFFCFHHTSTLFYLYLIPLLPFLHGEKLSLFAKAVILDNLATFQDSPVSRLSNPSDSSFSSVRNSSISSFFKSLFDDTAKSVDFILFFILFDILLNTNFAPIFFFALLFRFFFDFLFSFFSLNASFLNRFSLTVK